MLNRSTNERIVCVSFNDELSGWKILEKDLRSQVLKLPALKFSSHLGTPIVCELSNVKFLNEKSLSVDQLRPTSGSTSTKGSSADKSSSTAIDPFASAHEKPFLRVFLANGDDYKAIKPRVQEWLKGVGEYDEWLIIHLAGKESGFFSRSVSSSLRSDFVKGKVERVCVYRTFDHDATTNLLEDVLVKLRDGLFRAGQRLISEFSNRMKLLETQRNLASFNFLSFFAIKEGLALVYEALRSPSSALAIYDELELLFGLRKKESWKVNFPKFGGDAVGDDSGSLLDFGKKPYRTLLLARELNEFDFRQYLFARQSHLLFLLNNPSQVLSRGVKFIASFEDAMKDAKLQKLLIDVWCFSAFTDLAEACKAANQSTLNDPAINFVLGDAYYSAVTRLDELGAKFEFLPFSSEFIVGSTPIAKETDGAEDSDKDESEVEEGSEFTSPIKKSDSFVRSPLKIEVSLAESNEELPYTPEPSSSPKVSFLNAEPPLLVASADSDLPTSPVRSLTLSTDSSRSTEQEALGEDVEAQQTELKLDSTSETSDDSTKAVPVENPLPSTSSETTTPPEVFTVPTTQSVQSLAVSSVAAVSKSTSSSPKKQKVQHTRNKSRSSNRTHSRNSSIGEDIFLGDDLLRDADTGFESPNGGQSPRELNELDEETADSERIQTFPQLKMALLSALQTLTVRVALGKALNISEGDSILFDEPDGAVFALSYLQASNWVDDTNFNADRLLEVTKDDPLLSEVTKIIQEYNMVPPAFTSEFKGTGAMATNGETNGTNSSHAHSSGYPLPSHPVNGVSQSLPSSPPQRAHSEHSPTSPLFSFTRVVSPDSGSASSSSSSSSSGASAAPSRLAAPSPTHSAPLGTSPVMLTPATAAKTPSAPNSARTLRHTISTPVLGNSDAVQTKGKRSQFHSSILKDVVALEGKDGPMTLEVEGLTITHPSLSSALADANAFEKLFRSVALKSNAAFVAVNRARSSVRVKNALGNLAFARGKYQEALKYFDDNLITVYVAEGWDRLLFALYNKIAECYLKLNMWSEYCSTLICLLVPRLKNFATQEQRLEYQKLLLASSASLSNPLPVSIDAKQPLDKLLQLRVAVISPADKTPQTSIRGISSIHFELGDTVTIRATINSTFPADIVVDKFFLTFQAHNSKTQKTRSSNVGTAGLTLKPGTQTISLSAQMPKGRWALISFSILLGKITVSTKYFHPGPISSTSFVYVNVAKSVTNTKLTIARPTCLLLEAPQFLKVSLESNGDTLKETQIGITYDSAIINIPQGNLKAMLTLSEATSETRSESEVVLRDNKIFVPELPKNATLVFYLPISTLPPTTSFEGQLKSLTRELKFDLAFRKASNERKALSQALALTWNAPLAFEHHIVPNESVTASGDAQFVSTIVKNVSSVPIFLKSHTTTTEGSIVLTQDFNAAFNVHREILKPGDFTTLLLAIIDPSSTSHHKPHYYSTDASPRLQNKIEIVTNVVLHNDTGFAPEVETAYTYKINYLPQSPIYKVDLKFAQSLTVGILSDLSVDLYLPFSERTSSESFAAYYRLAFDPVEWVVTGKTHGRFKVGNTSLTLGLIPLTATASAPTIRIEEYSNYADSKTKTIVPEGFVGMKHWQSTLNITPQPRISSICREVHN